MSGTFQSSKNALCKKAILQHPNINKPYTVFTDTSNYAFSAVHTQAVDGPSDLRPIAYTSGSFSDMQQRWSLTQKGAYVTYQSVLKFDLYLGGAQCILCCNHKYI